MRDGCPRSREHGDTLIELMLTIVVAGIAFAALVPLFVNAAQASAGDKMERIRSLPYGDVTLANVNNGVYASAHSLGNSASVGKTNGGKKYVVIYDIQRYPRDSQPGLELYKEVTVDVFWVGSPLPVKHTMLKTDVYRQYAAPTVVGLDVALLSQDTNTKGMIVPSSLDPDNRVTITAQVETAVPVMEVRFTLTSANGSYKVASTQPPTGTSGVYEWKWPWTVAVPDGFYTITATAVSQAGYAGNTWHLVEQLEMAKPSPVNPDATAGNNSVAVSWEAPTAGDIAGYAILRSTTPEFTDAQRIAEDVTALSYPDLSAVNGPSYYYYWVYAIDLVGNWSDQGEWARATPSLTGDDHIPPTTPILTAVARTTSIDLSWTPSLDATGIDGYLIYRSTDGANFSYLAPAGPLANSYSDGVGTDSPPYWYEILAVDASVNANRSAFSVAVGPLQTPATKATLTVTNDRTAANKPCTVTVQDNHTMLYYDQNGVTYTAPPPYSPSIPSKGGLARWLNLPIDGFYTVKATYSSGQTLSLSVPPPWTVSFR